MTPTDTGFGRLAHPVFTVLMVFSLTGRIWLTETRPAVGGRPYGGDAREYRRGLLTNVFMLGGVKGRGICRQFTGGFGTRHYEIDNEIARNYTVGAAAYGGPPLRHVIASGKRNNPKMLVGAGSKPARTFPV